MANWDYTGGTISDDEASRHGVTLRRDQRVNHPGTEGKFTDRAHVYKDGTHVGTLVTQNDGRGRSTKTTLPPERPHDLTQLPWTAPSGAVDGHDVQWLLNRHQVTNAGAQYRTVQHVLAAHGAERDRFSPRQTRYVLKRPSDRTELIVVPGLEGSSWSTMQRTPTFRRGVPAALRMHGEGETPSQLHTTMLAWKKGLNTSEAVTLEDLVAATLLEGREP